MDRYKNWQEYFATGGFFGLSVTYRYKPRWLEKIIKEYHVPSSISISNHH